MQSYHVLFPANLILLILDRLHLREFCIGILLVFLVVVGDRLAFIVSVCRLAVIVKLWLSIQAQPREGCAESHGLEVAFPALVIVALVPIPGLDFLCDSVSSDHLLDSLNILSRSPCHGLAAEGGLRGSCMRKPAPASVALMMQLR
jgi:hypothetical protein